MDIIRDLSELALASRLKRLADRLMKDVSQIYTDCNIEFEARWFPVLYALNTKNKMNITDLASALSVSHTAVNQLVSELIQRGLAKSEKDRIDERQRLLQITDKGKSMVKRLEPIWSEIRNATREIIKQSGSDILDSIERIEVLLDQEGMYTRITRRIKENIQHNIEILDYQPAFKKYFKSLNREWLNEYFAPENEDERLLNDPRLHILKRGGIIVFARLRGKIVGTCALLKHKSGIIELAKMAVSKPYRGIGIGTQLLNEIISRALEQGYSQIYLQTNPSLKHANRLYQRSGFIKISNGPLKDDSYQRATYTMCLNIDTENKINN
jgi:N-acetylglutamate synthase-like GNAT family acetyltransferase/DNA-binding MarR family transcriptional regulator